MAGWTWWSLGNRPAVFPAVAILGGAAVAATFEVPAGWFLVSAAGAGGIALWRQGRSFARLAMLVAWAGLGATLASLHAGTEGEPVEAGKRVVLEGEVESFRAVEGGALVGLAVSRLSDAPARLRVQAFGLAVERLEPGARVRVEARLRPLVPTSNPGEWNGWRRALGRGQAFAGSFEGNRLVVLEAAAAWRRWLTATHARLEAATRAVAPSEAAASLFLTLSAGLRATLDEQVEDDFARSGLAHVLSVSGLHVAVLAFALFALVRRLALFWPGRLFRRVEPGRVAAPLSLPLTWGYVVFTGLQAPAVRSAVMCSVLLLGHTLRRRSDGLNALAIAGVVMLVLDPSALFDLSLQLSFSAVLALLLVTPGLRALVPVPVPSPAVASGLTLKLWKWNEAALTTALASVAVTAVSAPLVAATFQRLGVAGLVSNVVAMPVSGALTLLAASSAAAFTVTPGLATPLLWLGTRLSEVLLGLAQWFAALPFATWEVAAPPPWIALVWWAGLFAFVLLKGRWRWLTLATPLAAVVHLAVPPLPVDAVEVTFLAVGHGDATVVSHRGHHLLIDGGGVPNGADTGARFVLPFLRQRRITSLDLAVLSHAHPDHALGLISTLEKVPTKRLWLSPSPAGPLTTDLIAAADGAEIEVVERGHDGLTLGALQVDILGPPADRSTIEEENDRSIVLKLTHGAVSFLLTGDIEVAGEEALGAPGEVTVVKAPHHGSDTSSTPGLVAATRAKYVVFCVGRNNRFKFPRDEVVERWERAGARCYRTDRDGAVTFRSDGRDVEVETYAPKPAQARRRAWFRP
ncbi:MAG: DNA internalization-related competence protein ComEC/Rec2 [Myxococcaceae bacterium]|jgi:competence protein ComEC|nr:DNA internalization-related competence protein ComEC/Rec2 [Myxococcaceae bacterium]